MTDDDQDKFCPACDERRRWFHDECPECGTPLVVLPERYADADRPPVSVLTTSDPAALNAAELALDEAGIVHQTVLAEPGDMAVAGLAGAHAPGVGYWTVKVRAMDESRAREALVDLDYSGAEPEIPLESSMEWVRALPPVELFESDSGRTVGHLTDEQLDWLSGQLDESAVRDREFVLDPALIASCEQAGAAPGLMDVLRGALGSRREVRLRWGFV